MCICLSLSILYTLCRHGIGTIMVISNRLICTHLLCVCLRFQHTMHVVTTETVSSSDRSGSVTCSASCPAFSLSPKGEIYETDTIDCNAVYNDYSNSSVVLSADAPFTNTHRRAYNDYNYCLVLGTILRTKS